MTLIFFITPVLLGVIISKRQIGKALVFANIVPPREGLVVDQMGVRRKNMMNMLILSIMQFRVLCIMI